MKRTIEDIRADFPILSSTVHGRPLAYLDSGATAQKPVQVLRRMDEVYTGLNANVHRGVHYLSEQMTMRYEAARSTVRSFINAESDREIIFTSGATAGINIVACSFSEKFISQGDNIVITEMEHHSNIVPWQMACQRHGADLRVLPFDDDGRLMVEKLADLIDGRTRIMAVTQASNVLGTVPDLREIIDIAHRASVPVLVDGCQGIVHGSVDVGELDCDFYVFSGHKLYGPTGIGVLYGKQNLLEQMPPFMGGGDMVATVSFDHTTFADLPLKYEAGTTNFVGAVGLAAAIDYVSELGMDGIRVHENKLLALAEDSLRTIDGVRIYGATPGKCPIISFVIEGTHPYDVGMILDKLGVAIRTGHHCAQPVIDHYGLAGLCRASFALYNTEEEVARLAEGVGRASRMLR